MIKKFISAVLLLVTFSACLPGGKEDQTVTVDNRYTLTIPGFLEESHDLNDEASLQYQNLWKELYVIVIDESKTEMTEGLEEYGLSEYYSNDLDGYYNLLYDNMELLTEPRQVELIDTEINGMTAKLLTMKGIMEDVDIYYTIAFVEGKDRYYQVMVWTLAERQETYEEEMKRIVYTLKEI